MLETRQQPMISKDGRLFPLIGGFIGIAIGVVVSRIVFPPITIYELTTRGCFGRTSQVSIASVAIIIGSGIAGLIAFSYLDLKIRKDTTTSRADRLESCGQEKWTVI